VAIGASVGAGGALLVCMVVGIILGLLLYKRRGSKPNTMRTVVMVDNNTYSSSKDGPQYETVHSFPSRSSSPRVSNNPLYSSTDELKSHGSTAFLLERPRSQTLTPLPENSTTRPRSHSMLSPIGTPDLEPVYSEL